MAKRDGDSSLSEEAQDLDGHVRGLISDVTDLDVSDQRRKRLANRDKLLWVAGLALVVVFILLALSGFFDDAPESEGHDVVGSAETVDAADADQGSQPSVADSDSTGPLSGTWLMYRTSADGDEGYVASIRFTGGDTGTFEIIDEKASGTAFQVEGDRVSFQFTRTFTVPIGEWPENSYFEGTLTRPDEMEGEWARQAWECWPDPDAGCATHVEWSRYPSRLVRQP